MNLTIALLAIVALLLIVIGLIFWIVGVLRELAHLVEFLVYGAQTKEKE